MAEVPVSTGLQHPQSAPNVKKKHRFAPQKPFRVPLLRAETYHFRAFQTVHPGKPRSQESAPAGRAYGLTPAEQLPEYVLLLRTPLED